MTTAREIVLNAAKTLAWDELEPRQREIYLGCARIELADRASVADRGVQAVPGEPVAPDVRALIANDSYAMSFQSMGQYRSALLNQIPRKGVTGETFDQWFSRRVSEDSDPPCQSSAMEAWNAASLAASVASPAAPASPVVPRLIGWRTSDYRMETADKKMADNWASHYDLLPIFEGDPNTSLTAPASPVVPLTEAQVGPDYSPVWVDRLPGCAPMYYGVDKSGEQCRISPNEHLHSVRLGAKVGDPDDAPASPSVAQAEPSALAEMEARKDAAYLERNQVVAALAKVFPSGVKRTAIEGWSEDWHGCVFIDLPTGQASWHFHDSQAYLFDGLPPYTGEWDGHDTPEKYRRLAALPGSAGAASLTASEPEPMFYGRWHHGNGNLCCGSMRYFRADFDTNPAPDVREGIFDWVCTTMNAALDRWREQKRAADRASEGEAQATLPSTPKAEGEGK